MRPALARTAFSTAFAIAGLSRRNSLAFSRPCPSRWLSYENQAPDFSMMPLGTLMELGSYATPRGTYFDAATLHVITRASLAALREVLETDGDADVRRFRPNVVVDTGDAHGFVEAGWTGSTLALGACEAFVDCPTPRCSMPIRAQAGLPAEPRVLKAIVAHAERCRTEIARLESAEERGAEATAALAEAQTRRAALGKKLSAGRAKAARPLEERVAAELAQLAMDGARLEVVLDPHPEEFGASGRETVELRVAPNPGIEPAPLRDAASGGELSRVMLALSGLGPAAGAATMVFDEIDAGIGGNTARVVGERLRALGAEHQVLCITHLPQVASLADAHFRLEKDVAGDAAIATVERLDGEGVVEEIRRMLGGEQSDEAATHHARELLRAA